MKKILFGVLALMAAFGILGCSQNRETAVRNTFKQTPSHLVEDYVKNSKDVISVTYFEMNDGTWRTDDYAYTYRLVITGRLNNAEKDITYTILSNIENISFEQAWKASGLSSYRGDYFNPEDAVFVATKMG